MEKAELHTEGGGGGGDAEISPLQVESTPHPPKKQIL